MEQQVRPQVAAAGPRREWGAARRWKRRRRTRCAAPTVRRGGAQREGRAPARRRWPPSMITSATSRTVTRTTPGDGAIPLRQEHRRGSEAAAISSVPGNMRRRCSTDPAGDDSAMSRDRDHPSAQAVAAVLADAGQRQGAQRTTGIAGGRRGRRAQLYATLAPPGAGGRKAVMAAAPPRAALARSGRRVVVAVGRRAEERDEVGAAWRRRLAIDGPPGWIGVVVTAVATCVSAATGCGRDDDTASSTARSSARARSAFTQSSGKAEWSSTRSR